jgi:hypothetical protein
VNVSYSDVRALIESIPIEHREAIVFVALSLLLTPATYVLLIFVGRRLRRNTESRVPSKSIRLWLDRTAREALHDETERPPE